MGTSPSSKSSKSLELYWTVLNCRNPWSSKISKSPMTSKKSTEVIWSHGRFIDVDTVALESHWLCLSNPARPPPWNVSSKWPFSTRPRREKGIFSSVKAWTQRHNMNAVRFPNPTWEFGVRNGKKLQCLEYVKNPSLRSTANWRLAWYWCNPWATCRLPILEVGLEEVWSLKPSTKPF